MKKKTHNHPVKIKPLPFKWNTVPLLRLLIAFVLGIVLQIFMLFDATTLLTLVSLAVSIFLTIAIYYKYNKNYAKRWLYGFTGSLLFMCLGMSITFVQSHLNYQSHYSNIKSNQYVVKLIEPVVVKPRSVKLIVEVVAAGNPLQRTTGKLLCYLQSSVQATALKYGDILVFNGSLQTINAPADPAEFNYKRFLYFHQIFSQVYLKPTQWKLVSSNNGNALFTYSYELRQKLVNVFKTYLSDTRLIAVASALTVGYDDNIDIELMQAYASAGALHVLSVSGMHVGLVYGVLVFLLAFMDKHKWLKHLKFLLLILFLMFYAILTGMSPSVMRSAAMLCFVILGQWIGKQNLVYNTLTISAIVLLCYNPFYITEVGFQLSYAAVFGIVYLHPLINKWYEPTTFIARQIWTITSVSLAAQLLTFPLGLLYFHQFPILFIISNLIVIPCSTVVIFAGIALLLVSFFVGLPVFAWIAVAIAKLLTITISFINFVVLRIDAWPQSIINGISISIAETWIIYLIIFIGVSFLVQQKAQQLSAILIACIVLACMQLFENFQIYNQKQLVVYSVKKHRAIDFINGKQHYFIADSSLLADKSKLLFHVIHYWWETSVEPKQADISQKHILKDKHYFRNQNIINFNQKKILLIDSNLQQFNTNNKINFDYGIISHCRPMQVIQSTTWANCKQYIADATLSKKDLNELTAWARKKQIIFYNVQTQGAFMARW
ncbi:MAG TPA: ComEC/Rec2 family competence protein [Bacteroidia bacterium]|nr:ComEC/Rec2 family competence protein [Bacteroidia bacterium]